VRNRILLISALLGLWTGTLSAQGRQFFDIKPTGSITFSGGSFVIGGEGLTTGLKVNDIRLGLRADIGHGWSSELIMGFTRGQVSFKEMYLCYTFPGGRSRVQTGHFSEPFGLEYYEAPPFNRISSFSSPTQAFAAKRSVGIQYTRWNDVLWGAAGLFADKNLMKGVTPGPQGYAFTARALWNPRRGNGAIVHAGLAATYRRADGNGTKERSIAFSSDAEAPFDATAFAAVTVPSAHSQAKLAFEGIFSSGRFLLTGEGFLARVFRTDGLVPYDAGGAYVQAGCILRGDRSYSYDEAKAKLGMCRTGTWEIMLRASVLDLDHAGSSLYGGKLSGLTLNANWYTTQFIRLRFSAGGMYAHQYSPMGEGLTGSISAQIMIMLN